jgi:hypothetical protein
MKGILAAFTGARADLVGQAGTLWVRLPTGLPTRPSYFIISATWLEAVPSGFTT